MADSNDSSVSVSSVSGAGGIVGTVLSVGADIVGMIMNTNSADAQRSVLETSQRLDSEYRDRVHRAEQKQQAFQNVMQQRAFDFAKMQWSSEFGLRKKEWLDNRKQIELAARRLGLDRLGGGIESILPEATQFGNYMQQKMGS